MVKNNYINYLSTHLFLFLYLSNYLPIYLSIYLFKRVYVWMVKNNCTKESQASQQDDKLNHLGEIQNRSISAGLEPVLRNTIRIMSAESCL